MFGIWPSSSLLNEDFLLSGGGISILVWKSPDRFLFHDSQLCPTNFTLERIVKKKHISFLSLQSQWD